MATRRDQLQSYQFLTQRVISAFVMRETDPAQSPLRRGIGAVFAGVMVAIIVGAVFGVYGLLTKVGSNNWKVDGTVVVEKESGATFVYLGGTLHPTLNFTSALLAAGKPAAAAVRVAANSLSGVPRGVTIGIPGAPASLPPAGRMLGEPWTMCSAAGTDSATSTVTLAVGVAPAGARVLGDNQGLLVKDSATGGGTYLVWRGHRYPLKQPKIVVPALFGATAAPVSAGTSWLNALPAGVDIAPITVKNRGTASPAVPGRAIGDVLVVQTGAVPSYFLVLGDGMAPITDLQRLVLAAEYPVQPAPVSLFDANSAKRSNQLGQPTGDVKPPQSAPPLAQPASTDLLCAKTASATAPPEISVGGAVAQLEAATPTGSRSTLGTSLADRVLVPSGRIAVVREAAGSDGTGTGAYLVTDTGIRYPVPSDAVLTLLGYDPRQAVVVPESLLTRIPAGPSLDPAAATQAAKITAD
jgi:ESX secretion system ATPase EccB